MGAIFHWHLARVVCILLPKRFSVFGNPFPHTLARGNGGFVFSFLKLFRLLFCWWLLIGGSCNTLSRMYGKQQETQGTHHHVIPQVPKSLVKSAFSFPPFSVFLCLSVVMFRVLVLSGRTWEKWATSSSWKQRSGGLWMLQSTADCKLKFDDIHLALSELFC